MKVAPHRQFPPSPRGWGEGDRAGNRSLIHRDPLTRRASRGDLSPAGRGESSIRLGRPQTRHERGPRSAGGGGGGKTFCSPPVTTSLIATGGGGSPPRRRSSKS